MQARLFQISELDSSFVGEWRALAARALEPNPWFETHVVVPLAALRNDVALLVVRSRGRMHVCLPLIPATHRWHRIPVPAWMTPHPMGTPLVDPEAADSALCCGFTYLGKAVSPRFLRMQEVRSEGPVMMAITRAMGAMWRCTAIPPIGTWPALVRRPQCTYLEGSVGAKQRHNLRRLRRRLEERLGELKLVDHAGEAIAVERFLQLEASGWKGRRGTALACNPLRADYFRRVCQGFASEGRLHLLSLEAGATTVAMKVMTRAGEGLFELRVAYDERFSRFSPGVLLEIDAMLDFHDGRDAWVVSNTNFITSPLFRVWPDGWRMSSILAESPGIGGHVLAALLGQLRALVRHDREEPVRG